jgi:hypothetical protein
MADAIAGMNVGAEAAAISMVFIAMATAATVRRQIAPVAVAAIANRRQAAASVEVARPKAAVAARLGTVSIMGATNTTVTTRNTRGASSGGSSAGPSVSLSWRPI